jgi:hypothetical protein
MSESTSGDVAGEHLQEEPQAERGAPGSRDTGSAEPAGGPVDRPVGTADKDDDTSIEAQEPVTEGAPDLQSGAG